MLQAAQGGIAETTVIYRNGVDALVDPVNPRVDVLDPYGLAVVSDAVPTPASLGVLTYSYLVAIDAELGVWTFHHHGTVDGGIVEGNEFFSVVPPGSVAGPASYATLTELKDYVRIDDNADDAVLQLALDSASETIDAHCQQRFQPEAVPTARYFTAVRGDPTPIRRGYYWAPPPHPWHALEVDVDPISSVNDLEVAVDRNDDGVFEEVWVRDTDFRLVPYNAAPDKPWNRLHALGTRNFPTREHAVRVTARFGWPQVPASVRQACLIQASRFFIRRSSPFGIAGSPMTGGSELRLLSRLDPDVEALLRPYRLLFI